MYRDRLKVKGGPRLRELSPAARGTREAGFTQPRAHLLADPCSRKTLCNSYSHPISDLPQAQKHVPHGGGPRCGLDHPDGVAHRQRARQGLRLQQRPRSRRVLQQGLRAGSQEPILPEQVSWVYRLVHQVEDKFILRMNF